MSQLNLDALQEANAHYGGSVWHEPYPYWIFYNLLNEDLSTELRENWPDKDMFGQEIGVTRKIKGRRSHDRYFMSYSSGGNTLRKLHPIEISELPIVWQEFVHMILLDQEYHAFLQEFYGVKKFKIRFDWHMTPSDKDVSPHIDSKGKLGSHLFYMVEDDWIPEWGGSTYVLSDQKNNIPNPEIEDFDQHAKIEIAGNRSFIFKNTKNAWHAVDQIKCPSDRYRKLVSIVCLK